MVDDLLDEERMFEIAMGLEVPSGLTWLDAEISPCQA